MVGSLTIPLFAIRHKQIGGTEFAIYNLIRGLAQTSVRTDVFYDREQHLSPEFGAWLKENSRIGSTPSLEIPGPKNIRFLQETLFEWGLRKSEWVLYPNYFVPPRRPFSSHPSSVILHDIQYKVLPDYHSAARKTWLDAYLPWMLNRADSIVLISQSEKRYVEQFFGNRRAQKCDVVHNAIDWERFGEGSESAPNDRLSELLSRPYLLTVCHQFPHKNLQTLLMAFEQLASRHPDLQLYMVGTDSASNREFVATKLSATRERVRLLGFLSDRNLGLLYRNARLFVLPSLYEGFGMPAVEALGLGTPILVSGTTALPEVTLGLGSYVENPKDVEAWIWQLDSLISANDRPAPATVQKLKDTYSPRSIAQSLLSVLRKRG